MKITLDEALKRVIASLKVTLSMYEKAENLKDTEPEVYSADLERYISNPKIERAYDLADTQVTLLAKMWKLDASNIISMMNDLKNNRDHVKEFLTSSLTNHKLVKST